MCTVHLFFEPCDLLIVGGAVIKKNSMDDEIPCRSKSFFSGSCKSESLKSQTSSPELNQHPAEIGFNKNWTSLQYSNITALQLLGLSTFLQLDLIKSGRSLCHKKWWLDVFTFQNVLILRLTLRSFLTKIRAHTHTQQTVYIHLYSLRSCSSLFTSCSWFYCSVQPVPVKVL